MVAALTLGAGFGVGVLALAYGLRPPRPSLADQLAALGRRRPPAPLVAAEPRGWAARAGRPFAALLTGFGLPAVSVRRDLAVLGRPTEVHLAEKATAAFVGGLLPALVAALVAAGGLSLGWTVPLVACFALAVGGFVIPDLGVRADAATRRRDFRHALSAFLDLTVVALAGGAGVDAALRHAAASGQGWAYRQIRRALDDAHLSRQPPWPALGRLGDELAVTELGELAAAVALAGAEGAKVRTSLAAKAASLRTHLLTQADADAQAATERMSLPVVVLFAGFLLFLGFPAVVAVLAL